MCHSGGAYTPSFHCCFEPSQMQKQPLIRHLHGEQHGNLHRDLHCTLNRRQHGGLHGNPHS